MANVPARGLYAPQQEYQPLEFTLARLTFRRADLPAVRRFAAQFAAHAGMGKSARLAEFVLAVSEAAACAVSHGPCAARLQLCTAGARVFCDITDSPDITGDGMLVRHRPGTAGQGDAEALRRHLLRRICDHAHFEAGPHGATVRFSMTVA